MTKPVLAFVGAIGALLAPQQPASGTGEIAGVVIEAAAGVAVPNASVYIYGPGVGVNRSQRTDARGSFRFSNLSAGQFSVTANASGFVDGAIGKRRPWGDEVWVQLSMNEHKANYTILVFKEASISGRVVDQDNRPIVNFVVNAWPGPGNHNRAGTWQRIGVTNSAGDYTINNLIPGDYVVAAHVRHDTYRQRAPSPNPCGPPPPPGFIPPPPESLPPVGSLVERISRGVPKAPVRSDGVAMTYRSVYFPAATTPAEATPVILRAGDRLTSIDFQLAPVVATTVSGRLVSAKGVPLGSDVRLTFPQNPDPDSHAAEAQVRTEPDGTFTLVSVPTGAYILEPTRAIFDGSCDVGPGWDSDSRLTHLPIDVPPNGVKDLDIPLVHSVKVTGRIELNGKSQPPDQVYAGLSPIAASGERGMDPAIDRRIAMNAAAGYQYELTAWGSALETPWWLDRVTVNRRDVTGLPFEIPGPLPESVVVTLTDRPSKIAGVVVGATGRLVDATVILFPVDRTQWSHAAKGRLRFPIFRALDGMFEFVAVPAADYYIAAVDEATMDAWASTAFLTNVAAFASKVSVTSGVVRSVGLTLR